eukprot:4500088-Pyramimonas_sp.AAC.1
MRGPCRRRCGGPAPDPHNHPPKAAVAVDALMAGPGGPGPSDRRAGSTATERAATTEPRDGRARNSSSTDHIRTERTTPWANCQGSSLLSQQPAPR